MYKLKSAQFARVPFRVPGGPQEAGIALFPSIEQHGAGVSLHAAYFGNRPIPYAEDLASASPKPKTEPRDVPETLPVRAPMIPPSPHHASSMILRPTYQASPVGIPLRLPYSSPTPIGGRATLPLGPQIQPVASHIRPTEHTVSGSQYRSFTHPPPRVTPYPFNRRGTSPQRNATYSVYSPVTPQEQPTSHRLHYPPRIASIPSTSNAQTLWTQSPVVTSPDTLISIASSQRPPYYPSPYDYNMSLPSNSGGMAGSSAHAQPVSQSHGTYEPRPPTGHATPLLRSQPPVASQWQPLLDEPANHVPVDNQQEQTGHVAVAAAATALTSQVHDAAFYPLESANSPHHQLELQPRPQPPYEGDYTQYSYLYPYSHP